MSRQRPSIAQRFWHQLGRLRVRLLVVNLVVVLVPVAGMEFANIYERQLLGGLERDMRDQAIVVRRLLEANYREGTPLVDPRHQTALEAAATRTRTRIRVFDREREVVADSHRFGPPEGPEPSPPTSLLASSRRAADVENHAPWPQPGNRIEVREAFAGQPASYTRVRGRQPAVLLFLTEPIIPQRRVVGVVYVVRSTAPVLVELYRIRSGLYMLTGAALLFTLLVTLLLAWSISRPLSRLSRAASRIADGELDVVVPVAGSGEVKELGKAFEAMHGELRARLRFASEFAADVAHEFKSPLTSIRGAAELLQEGAADDPGARERFLGNILLDVERLDQLVSRLLELGRIEASAAATVRDAIVVQGMCESLAKRYPQVAIRCGKTAIIEGRLADLDRALSNLLDNALRYSPAPDSVSLDVTQQGPFVRFVVDDAGPGVPSSDRAKIFDRFFTADAGRKGTGLGLAIVRAVAEAHGGRVEVHDAPAGGARFVLTIPARRATPRNAAPRTTDRSPG